MKLFNLIQMQYNDFTTAVKSYLSKTLSNYEIQYGNNTIFGQMINVLGSAVQNIMLYIEDAITEQNKYTAQRKKSIYGLAAQSGYNPSLGKAANCVTKIIFKPNSYQELNVILPNRTKLYCSQNGLVYNVVLPQEAIILNIENKNSTKHINIVEGRFESQSFVSTGGQLYTQNVTFNGDIDIDYLEVKVNDEVWERVDSLYDMDADGKQFVCRTSIKKGIDLIFGNNQYGRQLKQYDKIQVTYLVHSGEIGNINQNEQVEFIFKDNLKDISGNEVDGNQMFNVRLSEIDGINSGTYSESIKQVREMIGYNSRSFVLADPKNYKNIINKFSFCGYNRTWCEEGSLVINSIILKNYKLLLDSGLDYFSLKETDFFLNESQKQSIISFIEKSGQQLAGTVFKIFEPELCKYAMYVYVKTKTQQYDQQLLTTKIRTLIGEFFSNVQSDIFIPKSDIVHLLKDELEEIDSVDVYFISQKNEEALDNGYYENKVYRYNPSTNTYDIKTETIKIYNGEDPGIGLDSHGNIYLDNNDQFPVLMGGWTFTSTSNNIETQKTTINDPLTIVFE